MSIIHGAEHRLLLAVSAILKGSYPHLDELHAAVENNLSRLLCEAVGFEPAPRPQGVAHVEAESKQPEAGQASADKALGDSVARPAEPKADEG